MSECGMASRAGRRGYGALRLAAVAAVLLTLVAVGCGRNKGSLPDNFGPAGQGGQDNFLFTMVGRAADTGQPAVAAVIVDRTPANGYRLYRKRGTGGFEEAVDYVLPLGGASDLVPFVDSLPTREFTGTFTQGYETYITIDRGWQPGVDTQYLARGLVGGEESVQSPLTNFAFVPSLPFESLLAQPDTLISPVTFLTIRGVDTILVVPTYLPGERPVFVWQAVPGATHYLLKVVRVDEQLFYYALLDAPALGAGVGPGAAPSAARCSFRPAAASAGVDTVRSGGAAIVLQDRPFEGGNFEWFVLALDAGWRLCGYSLRPEVIGRGQFQVQRPD